MSYLICDSYVISSFFIFNSLTVMYRLLSLYRFFHLLAWNINSIQFYRLNNETREWNVVPKIRINGYIHCECKDMPTFECKSNNSFCPSFSPLNRSRIVFLFAIIWIVGKSKVTMKSILGKSLFQRKITSYT